MIVLFYHGKLFCQNNLFRESYISFSEQIIFLSHRRFKYMFFFSCVDMTSLPQTKNFQQKNGTTLTTIGNNSLRSSTLKLKQQFFLAVLCYLIVIESTSIFIGQVIYLPRNIFCNRFTLNHFIVSYGAEN